jgi:BlaI family penicillinase repressor
MKKAPHAILSRRERQIMDILYKRGRATAAEIHHAIAEPPSYSAVRAKLRVLEEKGHIRHEEESLRYVYLPTVPRERAKVSALRHMLETFFEGSAEKAVITLLSMKDTGITDADLERLAKLVDRTKKEGA